MKPSTILLEAEREHHKANPFVVAVCDHVRREVLKTIRAKDMDQAMVAAKEELSGWMEKGDRIVTEDVKGVNGEWKEVMIQCPDGSIIDFYVEIHKKEIGQ